MDEEPSLQEENTTEPASTRPSDEELEQTCNLQLTCNGVPITGRIDTGSQFNLITQAKARQLKLPIRSIKNIPKIKRKEQSHKLKGFIKGALIQYGNGRTCITADLFVVPRLTLPCDLMLGYESTRLLSTAEQKFPPRIFSDRSSPVETEILVNDDTEEAEVSQELLDGFEIFQIESKSEDVEEEIGPPIPTVLGIMTGEIPAKDAAIEESKAGITENSENRTDQETIDYRSERGPRLTVADILLRLLKDATDHAEEVLKELEASLNIEEEIESGITQDPLDGFGQNYLEPSLETAEKRPTEALKRNQNILIRNEQTTCTSENRTQQNTECQSRNDSEAQNIELKQSEASLENVEECC